MLEEMKRHLQFLEDSLVAVHNASCNGSSLLMEVWLTEKIKEVKNLIKYEEFRATGVLPKEMVS